MGRLELGSVGDLQESWAAPGRRMKSGMDDKDGAPKRSLLRFPSGVWRNWR